MQKIEFYDPNLGRLERHGCVCGVGERVKFLMLMEKTGYALGARGIKLKEAHSWLEALGLKVLQVAEGNF